MATNPIVKATKTIGINMSVKMANELEKRATSMHLSSSTPQRLYFNSVVIPETTESFRKASGYD